MPFKLDWENASVNMTEQIQVSKQPSIATLPV